LTNTVRASAVKSGQTVFTQTTQVTVTPNLQISKVRELPLGSSVRVSDTVRYRLTYTNTGTAVLHNIVISDDYDSHLTFVSASPPPNIGNNRWTFSSLSAGQMGFIVVDLIVKAPQPDGGSIINSVTIDSDETTPQEYPIPPIPLYAPVLSLSATASPSPVQANAPLTYTLRYTNSGSTYASSTVVTSLLPSNVAFATSVPTYTQKAGNLLTWNFGQVISNSTGLITVSVVVNNNLDNGTILTDVSRISAAELVSATAQITTLVNSAPNVVLGFSDNVASVVAGQTITYNLPYTNTGNARAQNVVITQSIPANVAFQSCLSCTSMGSGVYSFTLGTVNAATSGSARLTVKVNTTLPAGLRAITSTARIQTTTAGDNPADNFAQDVDTVATVPVLALNVKFDSNKPVYPSRIITHTVRYTNTSAMNTTGVVLTVTKSADVTYVSSGSSAWNPAGGNNYTYNVGNLAAGASGVLTYIVSLPLYPFTATMTAFVNVFVARDGGPGGLPPASAVQTVTVGVPDLIVESVSISPASVVVGQHFTATVRIRNQGIGTACNADVPTCIGPFAVDMFIDPSAAPVSFPYAANWNDSRGVNPLGAGSAVSVIFEDLYFATGQDFILYFKVDNWDCTVPSKPCNPDYAQHGLAPESNEYNNVLRFDVPDAAQNRIYLPLVRKNN
jgi:uncharacterized repeat protein (TIGR01451 family)